VKDDQLELLLDKYACGTIDQSELNELEIKGLMQASIPNKMKVTKDIYKAFEYMGNEELKTILEKIYYQDIKPSTKKSSSTLKQWLSIGLVAAIGLALLLINKKLSPKEQSPTELYAQYYEDYQPSGIVRGSNESNARTLFLDAYKEQNYRTAMNLIEDALEDESIELQLVYALCALHENENENAYSVLNDYLIFLLIY